MSGDKTASRVEQMRLQRRRRLQAAARYRRERAAERGLPTGLMDAEPVRARALALMDLGWRAEAIAHLNGTGSPEGLRRIVDGSRQSVERKWAPLLNLPLTYRPPSTLPPTMFVPAVGATRRVQALLAMGWPLRVLSAAAGRELQFISVGKYASVTAGDWRRIDAVFEAHAARLGPSELTRSRSRTRGLVPPLGWNDIDDPTERPRPGLDRHGSSADDLDPVVVQRIVGGEYRLRATHAEKVAVIRHWENRQLGSLSYLEQETGWNVSRYLVEARDAGEDDAPSDERQHDTEAA